MKSIKTLALLLALILTLTSTAYAKNTNSGIKKTVAEQQTVKQPNQLMFDGIIYTLKYSTNQTRSGEYMNEYYKSNEKGSDWTELITVSEFPNYPNKTMDYAESILSRDSSPNNYDRPLVSNSRTEKVTFVFLLIGKTDEYKYIEFNVMQALPYKNYKGLKTILYTKRYKYTTREEYQTAFNQMETDKQRYFNLVKEMEIPAVVHENIE